jgi:hypothetical protein
MIKFPKQELLYMGLPEAAIEDEVAGTSRWSVQHEIVFEKDGKFYRTYYSIGATEMQDESPWEYDNEVECWEVHKVQKMMEVWEAV